MVHMQRGRGGVNRHVLKADVAACGTLKFVPNGDSPITITFSTAQERLDLAVALLGTLPVVYLAASDEMQNIVTLMGREQALCRAAVDCALSNDHLVTMGRQPIP